jgi:uncharacterized membrane protein
VDVDVEVDAVIPFPVERVSGYAGDPGNAPDWYANIRSVTWRTPPPVAIGSRMDFVAHFLGRKLVYTYEVVEHDPGRRLVMRTSDGPFPMRTTYTWEPVDGGTLMSLRNTGTPSGFSKVAAPMMARAMRSAMTKDLQRLRERLSAR